MCSSDLAAQLAAMKPDAVAVVIMNAYLDPAFEARIADGLQRRMQAVPIAASTAIWSEMREYERATVAVMNAYVAPTTQGYYARLERGFHAKGFTAPLSMTTSNGGTIDFASPTQITLAESRPSVTLYDNFNGTGETSKAGWTGINGDRVTP